MLHPLVDQLRFTRSEWLRGLDGVSEEDAARHFGPMNSISWIVGHLAWQEHRYFVERGQGKNLFPTLHDVYRPGSPMTTPSLVGMRRTWDEVTHAADAYLDTLTSASLLADLPHTPPIGQGIGTAVQKVIYHYWYHIGEIQAIRQMTGHIGLPDFVGEIEALAPYRPE